MATIPGGARPLDQTGWDERGLDCWRDARVKVAVVLIRDAFALERGAWSHGGVFVRPT